jgi:copper transport protein
MRPTAALLIVMIALALAALSGAKRTPVVTAHALLLSAEPPVNAQVRKPPRELTLRFSEPLERRFSTVEVMDQDGRRLDEGVTFDDADGTVMRVAIGEAGPGYLIVSWETVSVVDGHRIAGSYPVTILNPDGSAPSAPPPTLTTLQGDEVRLGLAVSRFLLVAAGCLLAGALLFVLFVTPAFPGDAAAAARAAAERRAMMAALPALGVIAVAAALELASQASDLGASAADVLDTRWGERWLVRNAFFVIALIAVLTFLLARRASPALRHGLAAAGLAATVGAFVAISSTSHAAAGAGAVWATAADFVHLSAATVWVGLLAMLALLFVTVRRGTAPDRHSVLTAALQRFSSIAVVSMALLLFTGVLSAIIEVARLDDLVDSAYGRALLVKLLLVLPLLAIAGYNAYVLRPSFVTAAETARTDGEENEAGWDERRLLRMLGLEIAVVLAVFAVVGVLVQVNPTRASASRVQGEPFAGTQQLEGMSVTLRVEPNLPGVNAFAVALEGETDFVEQVRLEFFDRSGATSESRLELAEFTPGTTFTGQGPFLSTASDWQVRVNLRQGQGSDLSVPFDVAVGGGRASERGGDFASPVDWNAGRLAIVAVAGVIAAGIVLGSLRSPDRQGGYIGRLLNRNRTASGRAATGGAADRP